MGEDVSRSSERNGDSDGVVSSGALFRRPLSVCSLCTSCNV